MLDTNTTTAKKTVEKKKHSQIINVLKKFVRATTITKNILDLEINFTNGKLLVFALAVKK